MSEIALFTLETIIRLDELGCLMLNASSINVERTNLTEGKVGVSHRTSYFRGIYAASAWGHIRELKQATFLSTRTAAGSKLRRYRWRMMASAVLV